jgi:hypothetical protein
MIFLRRKFGEIFNIIREIRGLMAGFFAPSDREATIPNRLFGPVDRRVDRAKEEGAGR